LASYKDNVLNLVGIVGGGIPLATGSALAQKSKRLVEQLCVSLATEQATKVPSTNL